MGKSLKGKELGAGIGQRKDGLYYGRFTNRFGKRETLYGNTYSEIKRKLREAQSNDDKQINVVSPNTTLDEWFDICMTTCKKHIRDTTRRTYQTQYNRLRADLGWRKLTNLNLIVMQDAFNKLKSDKSRRDCKALLVNLLNLAVESDLLVKNYAPSIQTKINNEKKKEKRILTDSEIEFLYRYTKDRSALYAFFVVALNTGMRIGEILGLCWDCVDFEQNIIRVRRTLCNLSNGGKTIYEFHEPKTYAGIRNIPMTSSVRTVLLKKKMEKEIIKSRHEPQKGFEDLVFTTKTNKPIHASNMKDSINYLIAKINRENPEINLEHFTPHCLRHTFATNYVSVNSDFKSLQCILGHTTMQMTMDLYCHAKEDSIQNAFAVFEDSRLLDTVV